MITEQGVNETYCRVCGPDKGHAFSSCENVSGLRHVILLQDQEAENRKAELERLRGIEKKLVQAEATNRLTMRILELALDAYERLRGTVKL